MGLEDFVVFPHPNLLFEEDREASSDLVQTRQSFDRICEMIRSQSPDTLVLIQSLGGIFPDGITFFVPSSDEYAFDTADHGYARASFSCFFDRELAFHIQTSFHDVERKTYLLDGVSFPLPAALLVHQLLIREVPIPRLVVLGVSLEGGLRHFEYGSLIARALAVDTQKTLFLGSGNLSHCLSEDSVAGYVPDSRIYNDQVLGILESQSFPELFHIDPFLIQEVGEDLFRVLCTGLGFLSSGQSALTWKTLSYEESQGVGYLGGVLRQLNDQ